jgi:hypothetical protein
MKKVFRIWKMLESDLNSDDPIESVRASILSLRSSWPFECEGKTQNEIWDADYLFDEDWFAEGEDE